MNKIKLLVFSGIMAVFAMIFSFTAQAQEAPFFPPNEFYKATVQAIVKEEEFELGGGQVARRALSLIDESS